MICSCIYHPPDADASFFDYLINSVGYIVLENKETHIIGDFNINLLSDGSSDSRKLIRLMENQGFYQMQKNATRVTEKRESFNMAKNKVVRLVNKAKKNAIIDELEKNSSNLRVLWKTLESIFPTKSRDTSQVNLLEKNGTRYTSAEDMPNLLNEHFVSTADNIIEHNNGVDSDFNTLKEFIRCHKPEIQYTNVDRN